MVERLELYRKSSKSKQRMTKEEQQGGTLLTLAPHFRLLRMLVSHLNDGEMSAIDGLLGCPLYMPSEELFAPEKFQTLPPMKQCVLLSSLFFAANWFRELINAFVTQKLPELKTKVSSYGFHKN